MSWSQMNVVSNEVVSNEWSQMNWSQLSAPQHAHVAHMAKHMNMVGRPLWWGSLGSGPLGPP